MNVRTFESQEGWANWRLGKGTGSRSKKLTSTRADATEKYRMAAESIIGSAVLAEEELSSSQVMERGHQLEPVALARFAEATGKKVDGSLVGWESAEDSRIAISPDGVVSATEAIEVKCLLSPKHTEALFNRAIPKNTSGYEEQMIHYFVVNPKLKTLYYVFYHPDFPAPLDFFYLTFTRKELAERIAAQAAEVRSAVSEVRDIVNALTMYSPEEWARMKAVQEELLADAKATHEVAVKKVRKIMKSNTAKA